MSDTATSQRKYFIVASFSFILGINQLLWLNFAPIVKSTQVHFGVSEMLANLLTLIFPAVFVILSMHAGRALDKYGYKKIVSLAAIIMLAGSVLRLVGYEAYWVVFAGQLLIAISQPYMTNAINQITSDWFSKAQLQTVTGFITGGIFIGMMLGALLSAPLANAYGFFGLMLVNALITLAAVVFFLVSIKENNRCVYNEGMDLGDITHFLKNKLLWKISILVFIAIGFFNGLTNWLAPMLEPQGLDEEQAGLLAGLLIIGGILGSLVIPFLSDITGKRQWFIMLSGLSATACIYPLFFMGLPFNNLMALCGVMGFFFLAGYPILIVAAEHSVHESQAARAVALLMLLGNLGGVVVVIVMEVLKNASGNWDSATWFLMALTLSILPIAATMSFKYTQPTQAPAENP